MWHLFSNVIKYVDCLSVWKFSIVNDKSKHLFLSLSISIMWLTYFLSFIVFCLFVFFNLTSPCERVRANKLKPKVRHHVTELTVGQSQLWVFGQSEAEGHKHASPPQRKARKTDRRKTSPPHPTPSNLNKSTGPSAKTASGMTTCSHRSKCSTLSVSRQALKVAVMTCWALNGAVCCRAALDSPPASAALKPLALDATINLPHFTSLLLISPADAVAFGRCATRSWVPQLRMGDKEKEGSRRSSGAETELRREERFRKKGSLFCESVADKVSVPLWCHVNETLASVSLLRERRFQTGRPSHSGKRAHTYTRTHTHLWIGPESAGEHQRWCVSAKCLLRRL